MLMVFRFAISSCLIMVFVFGGGTGFEARAQGATKSPRPSWLWPELVPSARPGKFEVFPDNFGDATPEGLVLGPDGAIWFTDTGNDVIGRMTTQGVYTNEYPANGNELDPGITVGPDGALWFTAFGAGALIGRITTTGSLEMFNDTGGSFPQQITAGPDGALWFTESNGTVGRMTTSGKVSHFHVAASNATLEGIVVGPDGALWATVELANGSKSANVVVRLTTKGAVTTYTVGSGPSFICVGSDGALWFTEYNPVIGRLTTTGEYSQYHVGDKRFLQPNGIAPGPDGALWFTNAQGEGVGRLTTSGEMTIYRRPPGGLQIISGATNEMWYTAGGIVRLATGG